MGLPEKGGMCHIECHSSLIFMYHFLKVELSDVSEYRWAIMVLQLGALIKQKLQY